MDLQQATGSRAPANGKPELIGRVAAVSGAQSSVELLSQAASETATVGKFMGLMTGRSLLIGLITEVDEQPLPGIPTTLRQMARLDLIGEIFSEAGKTRFQRGVTEYPNIGDGALLDRKSVV